MRRSRRSLQWLNAARAVAVTTLLLAGVAIELFFAPGRSLAPLFALSAAGYGTILVYAGLERLRGAARATAVAQVLGDTALVAGFVVATGGGDSPLSFLFALPVVVAASLFGVRGGVVAACAAWTCFAAILGVQTAHDPAALPLGRAAYAAVSHLLGFVALAALGGALADKLRVADSALEEQRDGLAALRARHVDIVESITTGLLTTDGAGRVTFVNRAGAAILMLDRAALAGSDAVALLGLSPRIFEEAAALLATGRRCRFEQEWQRAADGQRLTLGFAVSPLRDAGAEDGGWLIVFQDLTGIVSLEEQVKTRERMAALGEMAAGMAHELRNPLTAISGCMQVIAQQGVPEDIRGLVDVGVRETERLNRIIRDFLQFARPGEFRPRPVDLAALMDEMVRILRKAPEATSAHRIVIEREPGATWAQADPDRIRQVFWNLAGNALKAMPEGGQLVIGVGGDTGGTVALSFRDQGKGMDPETMRRLFEPFHGRFTQGAGLGTAIVYRIVEEHRGRIQVLSRPGQGTEVRVILPQGEPAAAAPVAAVAEPADAVLQ